MDTLIRHKADSAHPATAPDLVLSGRRGLWKIARISPPLLRLLGRRSEEVIGMLASSVFSDTIPDPAEVATEALDQEPEPLHATLRFPFGRGVLASAEITAGGLSENLQERLIHFRFLSAESAPEPLEAVPGLVGNSRVMQDLSRKIRRYAPTAASVVITGETGTGKEVIARALHELGINSSGEYVAVNCSAISEELLESELFGHEKGSFTGATRTHHGFFERANKGTIFLDEIGEMPLHTQSKLLRVLEEGRITRVGAEQEQTVDVRVVCATNVPLEQAVGEGKFRMDLYHRLSVLRIHVPPLRERLDDIPALVDHFIQRFNRRYHKQVVRLTPEAISLLQSYLWPGNIRELRNVIERVFVETEGEVIGARAFGEWVSERRHFTGEGWGTAVRPQTPPLITPFSEPGPEPLAAPRELTPEAIKEAYRSAKGNLSAAARRLGVHRATFYRHLDRLGIHRDDL